MLNITQIAQKTNLLTPYPTWEDRILYDWPYFLLFLGIAIIIHVFLIPTERFKDSNGKPAKSWFARFYDPNVIIALGAPVFYLHQFEDYGLDLTGTKYSRLPFLCKKFYPNVPLEQCPGEPYFVLALNAAILASTLSAIFLVRRDKFVGICSSVSLSFVNSFTHAIPQIVSGKYDPGAFTSMLLFWPFAIWAYYVFIRDKHISVSHAVLSLFTGGVAAHIITIIVLRCMDRGWFDQVTCNWLQFLTGSIYPYVLYYIVSLFRGKSSKKVE